MVIALRREIPLKKFFFYNSTKNIQLVCGLEMK